MTKKHELLSVTKDRLTGKIGINKEYFFSIYNAKRRKFEIEDEASLLPSNIKTTVTISKVDKGVKC